MKVIIMQKLVDGEPVVIDEREWPADMLASLEHANFVVVNGKEFDMLEGRLNLDKGALEVLVVPVAVESEER